MKHAWVAVFALKLLFPVDPAGTCYLGPNCQGAIIRLNVTKDVCAHAGGHSLRVGQACTSF